MTPGDGWERARGFGSLPSTWRLNISHHNGGRGLGIVVFAGKFVYDTRKGFGKMYGTGSDRMVIIIGTESGKYMCTHCVPVEAVSYTGRQCMHSCE